MRFAETLILKCDISITKETDSYYFAKRNISKEYDPTGAYDFNTWKQHLTHSARSIYERLHIDLLYTDEKQSFDDALKAFEEIDEILQSIGE